jgi:hypothetical protein
MSSRENSLVGLQFFLSCRGVGGFIPLLMRILSPKSEKKERRTIMIYNIDFHGTIVDNLHDKWIREQFRQGRDESETSTLWDDYARFVYNTRNVVNLNITLLDTLSKIKDAGHYLRLFTNANYTLAKDIKHVLGDYVRLFDSFIFCGGKKSRLRIEGTIVDNEVKNLKCAEFNILVPTFEHKS